MAFWENLQKILEFLFWNSLKMLCVFILGFFIIKLILKVLKRMLKKGKIDGAAINFIISAVRSILYVLLFLIISQTVGIPMTGFIAIFSAASLAASLALQGSLSNLASGVIIIFTKPFKEGDMVSISDTVGSVYQINMLHTVLKSPDNKIVSIPNKAIIENQIVNFNKLGSRRVSFNFKISYQNSPVKAKKIILYIMCGCSKIYTTPAPTVDIDKLETDGISFECYAWCKSTDYFEVYYHVIEKVFGELKKNNILLPYSLLVNNEENLPHENKVTAPSSKRKKRSKTIKPLH